MPQRGGSGKFVGKEEKVGSGSRNPTQTWLKEFRVDCFLIGVFIDLRR